MNASLGNMLAGIARDINVKKGYTVEFDTPEGVYTSKHFQRVVYNTPENKGLRFGIGAHEDAGKTPGGKTRTFCHPDDADHVREMLNSIPVA